MKKSVSIWSFAGQSTEDAMALAKKAGFDGIELDISEKGEFTLESGDQAWLSAKSKAAERGLALPSLATGLFWQYSLTADDPAQQAKALHIARRMLEAAKLIGADTVLIVPGGVGVDFVPGFAAVPYDVAYDRALEAFGCLKKDAESLQVHIGIENVWNKFLLSPLEMRSFIDQLNSPYIGAYFDVGNTVAWGYPQHWISILGSRIKKVHFKDYRRSANGLAGFVDLLSGDVDWPAVMAAFKAVDYDGWVTAEMLPPYAYYPEQMIMNTANAMNCILGGKKHV
ncbi:MAG: sugar phosphate isomerase/epimerase family protein [Clostridiaceae bacterium]|nr:sugar phosphate isomerase/epimerase family protein [Clostridiaceae bacterium]